MTTPTIAALKTRYPEAKIDFGVGSWSRAVLENNPHLHDLIDTGTVGQGAYSLKDVWALVQTLRAQRYDLSVCLVRSPSIGLLPWLAGIPHRIGLDSYGRGFAHTVRVPVPVEPKHEALVYLACAEATGLSILDGDKSLFWPQFFPQESDRTVLQSLSASFVVLHPSGGVNPGMQMLDKRWPVDRFAWLSDRLAEQGLQIVLSGVESDIPLCQMIAQQMTSNEPLIVAGTLSLSQFGAMCQRATLFVGGDTGAMHLATACGCPVVAIFGPSDPRRYAAFGPPDRVQSVWRPFDIPTGGVGQGAVTNFSWEHGISRAEVWEACQRLLSL
ncbi:MAG: glycosyltransferase family 9 protein [Chloroflexota bacterium]